MLNKLITEPIHLIMVIGLYCILYHIFSECKYLFLFFLARSEYKIREAEPPTNYFIYENIFANLDCVAFSQKYLNAAWVFSPLIPSTEPHPNFLLFVSCAVLLR